VDRTLACECPHVTDGYAGLLAATELQQQLWQAPLPALLWPTTVHLTLMTLLLALQEAVVGRGSSGTRLKRPIPPADARATGIVYASFGVTD
jgi:hypothetical protein